MRGSVLDANDEGCSFVIGNFFPSDPVDFQTPVDRPHPLWRLTWGPWTLAVGLVGLAARHRIAGVSYHPRPLRWHGPRPEPEWPGGFSTQQQLPTAPCLCQYLFLAGAHSLPPDLGITAAIPPVLNMPAANPDVAPAEALGSLLDQFSQMERHHNPSPMGAQGVPLDPVAQGPPLSPERGNSPAAGQSGSLSQEDSIDPSLVNTHPVNMVLPVQLASPLVDAWSPMVPISQ
jgi:hypothetical protein